MTMQTEPGTMTLASALIGALLDKVLPGYTPENKPTMQQELRELIEEETLARGVSYHQQLLTTFGDQYSAREIEHAIRALRRTRRLNEHHWGPLDTAYTHNNRVKQFFADLPYV